VLTLHLEPALLGGWRVTRTETQGHDDWGGMRAESIRAFKTQSDDGLTRWLDGDALAQVLTLAEWRGGLDH
jgi:hypothetical protein